MSDNPSTEPAADEIDPDLACGEPVGEYVIDEKLGQGGFGAVFKASHPLIGKVVAIKVLARRFSLDPEMVERFQQEAKAVNQIRHRHIIDIFSFGKLSDGRAYYVMEFLDGETLGDRLDRDGKLEPTDALPILRAIGRALDAAHGKGIAHRDLKPDNVFLVRDPDGGDFPKLLDFGIAKLLRREDNTKSKTRTGVPMGTPYYMSPEQCRGRDVDHRTDFYAFGIVAYQMLTGTYPLDGDDYLSILMKQMSEDPPPASTRNPALTPAIDDALAWLMQKDPDARPPNLTTAVRALEQGAGIESRLTSDIQSVQIPPGSRSSPVVAAKPLTLAPPPAKRRLPLILGAAAASVVAALVAFTLLANHDDKPQPPPPVVQKPAVQPPVAPPKSEPKPEPPPPPPELQTVTLTLTDLPPNTDVKGPGGVFIGNPPTIQLPKSDTDLTLTFEAEGYKPTSRTIKPMANAELAIKLDKKPVARPVATPSHPVQAPSHQDTIEDPFKH